MFVTFLNKQRGKHRQTNVDFMHEKYEPLCWDESRITVFSMNHARKHLDSLRMSKTNNQIRADHANGKDNNRRSHDMQRSTMESKVDIVNIGKRSKKSKQTIL